MTEEELQFGAIWPLMMNVWDTSGRRKGVQELRKLAEADFLPAVFALGMAYFDGKGVRRDYPKAFELISKAAWQDYPSAVGFMGNFYISVYPKYGVVELDEVEANRWWEKAAREGNSSSQYNLAVSYQKGIGVPQSFRQAYIWASLAVKCSPIAFTAAQAEREQAAKFLSEAERLEADQEIRKLGQGIPHDQSEHFTYWQMCARAAGIDPD